MAKVIDSTNLGYLIGKMKAAFLPKGATETVGVDATPTASSTNLVESGGVYDAIQNAGGGSFTDTAKNLLISALRKAAWTVPDADDILDQLENALMNNIDVASIAVSLDLGGAAILDTDTLDDIKQYLTVTATFSDGTSAAVEGYTLTGSMSVGTNTYTVDYLGKTATFTATVLKNYAGRLNNWILHPGPNAGVAQYNSGGGYIEERCGNATDVSNYNVWAADGKTTLWSAMNGKTVKIRVKTNETSPGTIGTFGIGVYQSASISSLGNSYAKREGLNSILTLAADGYFECTFVNNISNFTQGSLSPGSNATYGLFCYARTTTDLVEIYDVQIYEVTP